jgi:hypothetical protein
LNQRPIEVDFVRQKEVILEGDLMTDELTGGARDEQWESLKQLHRECWKAYADIAVLKMMLKAVELSGELRPGWESRLEATRDTEVYRRYLQRGEAEIARVEQEREAVRFAELLSTMPPPEFLN